MAKHDCPDTPNIDERIKNLEQEISEAKKDIEEIVQYLKHTGYPNVWGIDD